MHLLYLKDIRLKVYILPKNLWLVKALCCQQSANGKLNDKYVFAMGNTVAFYILKSKTWLLRGKKLIYTITRTFKNLHERLFNLFLLRSHGIRLLKYKLSLQERYRSV